METINKNPQCNGKGNILQAGFCRSDITPPLGVNVAGYFKVRIAEEILDPLEVNCLCLACGEEKIALVSVDHLHLKRPVVDPLREEIAQVTGLPVSAIFIHCTHTHTAPFADLEHENPRNREFTQMLMRKTVDTVVLALKDLQPARMGYAVGQAPNVAFVRRFRMKDGSVQTNPGVDNPNILAPIGDVDERINVLRFDRVNDSIVLMNFGCHPDVVGGNRISCDWPGFARRTLERAIPGTKGIFFNGAQGDVNHVNVHPRGGYLNDLENDFDDVTRGYGHARFMGRVVAGGVMQVYDKVQYVDVNTLRFAQKTIRVPSNMPDPKDLPEAHRINDLHNAGLDAQLPYKGMMLTTKVAGAARMVRLEHGPEAFPMTLSAVSVGDIAMIGIPGEPFNGIGRGLKNAEGWDLVLPCCLTNGSEGYFPMQDAYDEGGYEASTSNFKAGVAELLIVEGTKLLQELKNG